MGTGSPGSSRPGTCPALGVHNVGTEEAAHTGQRASAGGGTFFVFGTVHVFDWLVFQWESNYRANVDCSIVSSLGIASLVVMGIGLGVRFVLLCSKWVHLYSFFNRLYIVMKTYTHLSHPSSFLSIL